MVVMWPLKCFPCAAYLAFLFCIIIFYLLVIGPRVVVKTQRGNSFLYYGRHILVYIVMSIPTTVYLVAASTCSSRIRCHRLRLTAQQLASKVLGINWEVRRPQETKGNCKEEKEESGAVLVLNHQLWIDFLALWAANPPFHQLAVVMKKENIILFPYILQHFIDGGVSIDRSKGASAYKQLESAAIVASRKKGLLAVFPEGSRNRDSVRWGVDGGRRIKEFKSGAFRAAIRAGLPIVPVVISPYYFVDEERLIFGKGKVIMKVLPKIPTEGLAFEDFKGLMERTHNAMSATYEELKDEVIKELPEEHYLRK